MLTIGPVIDIFKAVIPLHVIATEKVGPYSEHDGDHDGEHDTTHDENRVMRILTFCEIPRTRTEIQEFAGVKSRRYIQLEILKPLLDSGKLKLTLPDKPQSKFQKYVATKEEK